MEKKIAILEDDPLAGRSIQGLLDLAEMDGDVYSDVVGFLIAVMEDSCLPDPTYCAAVLDFWLYKPDGGNQCLNGEEVAQVLTVFCPGLELVAVTADDPGEHFQGIVGKRFSKSIFWATNPRTFNQFMGIVEELGGRTDSFVKEYERRVAAGG